jgi:hypothetical protein
MIALLVVAVALGYSGLYAGKAVAAEGAKSWAGMVKSVRSDKNASRGKKAAVAAGAGAAWLVKTGYQGVRSAVRDDIAMVRHAMSPAGRLQLAEARAHQEAKRRAAREWRKQAKTQKAGGQQVKQDRKAAEALERQRAKGPDVLVWCPTCFGQDPGCSTCGGDGKVEQRRVDPYFGEVVDPAQPDPPAAGHDAPAEPTPEPPAAPAAGPAPSIGDINVPRATGEAQNYEQMLSELALLAADGDQLVADAHTIAKAAEQLDGHAVRFKLDSASRGALSSINAACADVADAAGSIKPSAITASQTVQQKQGALHEAHVAQPEAADQEFLKA